MSTATLRHGSGASPTSDVRGWPRASDTPPAERLVHIDWLRVLTVFAVFLVHVAEPFNPWDEWHISNPQRSVLAGEVTALFAPWVMPLFMLLAGVSSWYSLARRTNAAYLKDRVARVLAPLVFGTALLVVPQVWLERRFDGQFSGSLLAFWPHVFDGGIYPEGNLSWHHLWFLGHLMLYAVIALPLFRYLQSPAGGRLLARLARITASPGGLFWLALPLVLERHLLWWMFRERHVLTSDWSNHAILFVAYVYGFVLAGQPWLAKRIDAEWRVALFLGAMSTTVLIGFTLTGIVPNGLPGPYARGYLLFWTFYALAAWAWMIAIIGAARRWLTRETPVLDFGRRNGFGWYLAHQTVIVTVVYAVVPQPWGLYPKMATVLVASFVGTLVFAAALQRIPVVNVLLGLRRQSRRPGAPGRPASRGSGVATRTPLTAS